jgi:hypothetical protein
MVGVRYNLFRNRDREDLCCAVPEDWVVPGFVTSQDWTFAGPVGAVAQPRGFNSRAAHEGARLNGFYVFQEARPTPLPVAGDLWL